MPGVCPPGPWSWCSSHAVSFPDASRPCAACWDCGRRADRYVTRSVAFDRQSVVLTRGRGRLFGPLSTRAPDAARRRSHCLAVEHAERRGEDPVLLLEDVLAQQVGSVRSSRVRPGRVVAECRRPPRASTDVDRPVLCLAGPRCASGNSSASTGKSPSSSTTVCGPRSTVIRRQRRQRRHPIRRRSGGRRTSADRATTASCSRVSSSITAMCWQPQYSHIRPRPRLPARRGAGSRHSIRRRTAVRVSTRCAAAATRASSARPHGVGAGAHRARRP